MFTGILKKSEQYRQSAETLLKQNLQFLLKKYFPILK